jgi:hypothetical protein
MEIATETKRASPLQALLVVFICYIGRLGFRRVGWFSGFFGHILVGKSLMFPSLVFVLGLVIIVFSFFGPILEGVVFAAKWVFVPLVNA